MTNIAAAAVVAADAPAASAQIASVAKETAK